MVKPKPLHVKVEPLKWKVLGINIFPAVSWLMRKLPDGMRKSTLSSMNAPKPDSERKFPRDLFDLTGKSPYKKEEVVPGKVWVVTYTYEDVGDTDKESKKQMKAFGWDPNSEDFKKKCLDGAASLGPQVVEVCKKDLEKAALRFNKETYTDEEVVELLTVQLRMTIVRLNNGSVMIYTPFRIREELATWIGSLGKVEWIVIGSCSHTLGLQAAFSLFPEAKVVGTPAAQEKMKVINAIPRGNFDINAEDRRELEQVNAQLDKEGVKMFYVEGDVATNALVVVAHGVALSVDLVYGHHLGGIFHIGPEEWREFRDDVYNIRLFYFTNCCKPHSPNGYLATYRFQMMDPTSLGSLNYDQPAPDGSSCHLMAASLREMLQLEFEQAIDVHSGLSSRADFQKTINAHWSWLDGTSLLSDQDDVSMTSVD